MIRIGSRPEPFAYDGDTWAKRQSLATTGIDMLHPNRRFDRASVRPSGTNTSEIRTDHRTTTVGNNRDSSTTKLYVVIVVDVGSPEVSRSAGRTVDDRPVFR